MLRSNRHRRRRAFLFLSPKALSLAIGLARPATWGSFLIRLRGYLSRARVAMAPRSRKKEPIVVRAIVGRDITLEPLIYPGGLITNKGDYDLFRVGLDPSDDQLPSAVQFAAAGEKAVYNQIATLGARDGKMDEALLALAKMGSSPEPFDQLASLKLQEDVGWQSSSEAISLDDFFTSLMESTADNSESVQPSPLETENGELRIQEQGARTEEIDFDHATVDFHFPDLLAATGLESLFQRSNLHGGGDTGGQVDQRGFDGGEAGAEGARPFAGDGTGADSAGSINPQQQENGGSGSSANSGPSTHDPGSGSQTPGQNGDSSHASSTWTPHVDLAGWMAQLHEIFGDSSTSLNLNSGLLGHGAGAVGSLVDGAHAASGLNAANLILGGTGNNRGSSSLVAGVLGSSIDVRAGYGDGPSPGGNGIDVTPGSHSLAYSTTADAAAARTAAAESSNAAVVNRSSGLAGAQSADLAVPSPQAQSVTPIGPSVTVVSSDPHSKNSAGPPAPQTAQSQDASSSSASGIDLAGVAQKGLNLSNHGRTLAAHVTDPWTYHDVSSGNTVFSFSGHGTDANGATFQVALGTGTTSFSWTDTGLDDGTGQANDSDAWTFNQTVDFDYYFQHDTSTGSSGHMSFTVTLSGGYQSQPVWFNPLQFVREHWFGTGSTYGPNFTLVDYCENDTGSSEEHFTENGTTDTLGGTTSVFNISVDNYGNFTFNDSGNDTIYGTTSEHNHDTFNKIVNGNTTYDLVDTLTSNTDIDDSSTVIHDHSFANTSENNSGVDDFNNGVATENANFNFSSSGNETYSLSRDWVENDSENGVYFHQYGNDVMYMTFSSGDFGPENFNSSWEGGRPSWTDNYYDNDSGYEVYTLRANGNFHAPDGTVSQNYNLADTINSPFNDSDSGADAFNNSTSEGNASGGGIFTDNASGSENYSYEIWTDVTQGSSTTHFHELDTIPNAGFNSSDNGNTTLSGSVASMVFNTVDTYSETQNGGEVDGWQENGSGSSSQNSADFNNNFSDNQTFYVHDGGTITDDNGQRESATDTFCDTYNDVVTLKTHDHSSTTNNGKHANETIDDTLRQNRSGGDGGVAGVLTLFTTVANAVVANTTTWGNDTYWDTANGNDTLTTGENDNFNDSLGDHGNDGQSGTSNSVLNESDTGNDTEANGVLSGHQEYYFSQNEADYDSDESEGYSVDPTSGMVIHTVANEAWTQNDDFTDTGSYDYGMGGDPASLVQTDHVHEYSFSSDSANSSSTGAMNDGTGFSENDSASSCTTLDRYFNGGVNDGARWGNDHQDLQKTSNNSVDLLEWGPVYPPGTGEAGGDDKGDDGEGGGSSQPAPIGNFSFQKHVEDSTFYEDQPAFPWNQSTEEGSSPEGYKTDHTNSNFVETDYEIYQACNSSPTGNYNDYEQQNHGYGYNSSFDSGTRVFSSTPPSGTPATYTNSSYTSHENGGYEEHYRSNTVFSNTTDNGSTYSFTGNTTDDSVSQYAENDTITHGTTNGANTSDSENGSDWAYGNSSYQSNSTWSLTPPGSSTPTTVAQANESTHDLFSENDTSLNEVVSFNDSFSGNGSVDAKVTTSSGNTVIHEAGNCVSYSLHAVGYDDGEAVHFSNYASDNNMTQWNDTDNVTTGEHEDYFGSADYSVTGGASSYTVNFNGVWQWQVDRLNSSGEIDTSTSASHAWTDGSGPPALLTSLAAFTSSGNGAATTTPQGQGNNWMWTAAGALQSMASQTVNWVVQQASDIGKAVTGQNTIIVAAITAGVVLTPGLSPALAITSTLINNAGPGAARQLVQTVQANVDGRVLAYAATAVVIAAVVAGLVALSVVFPALIPILTNVAFEVILNIGTQIAGNVLSGQHWYDIDFTSVAYSALLGLLYGLGGPTARALFGEGTLLARFSCKILVGVTKATALTTVAEGAYQIYMGNFIGGGALLLLGALGLKSAQYRGCFAAGTPLLTPDGDKLIEDFKAGDLILTAPEGDPNAPLEVKQVEEVFTAQTVIWHLHVGNEVIRTTGEHPFYVRDRGWVAAWRLQPGDLLRSHDGQWVPVGEVFHTGVEEPVYNLRVADYHTYFVATRAWGFSVWAHNSYKVPNRRTPWSVNGASARASHSKFGTFYKNPVDGTWWSRDLTGHGGSAWKVLRETRKGLQWIADADSFGNYIVGKHKSPVGQLIPWGHLRMQ